MKLRTDPGLYSGRVTGDYITIEVNGREADQAAMSLLEHEGWGAAGRRSAGSTTWWFPRTRHSPASSQPQSRAAHGRRSSRPARPTATCARPSTASTSNQVRTNVSQAKCDELLLDAPRRFATGRNLVGVCYLGVDHLDGAWRGADAPPEGLVLPARAPPRRFSHRRPPDGAGLRRSPVSRLTRSPARREARIPLQAKLAARRSARRAAR